MPAAQRPRIARTEKWAQRRLRCDWPEQLTYELIRPVVLFGETPAERARETGTVRRTLYRRVEQFAQRGLAGLLLPTHERHDDSHRTLPTTLRQLIVDLRAEHPAMHLREIATDCAIRLGQRPSHHTVRRVLAEVPSPPRATRRYPSYAEIAGPAERRLAIIRLHAEGWNVQSIASYLETTRRTIYRTLRRWIDEGVRGLEDRSRAPRTRVRKADLRAFNEVRALQENPDLGEFRVHAALKQLGIHLSPRTCGRILAHNRRLYGLAGPSRQPREPKEMPFKAEWRHQFWTVDVRYVDHRLGDGRVYCISILENYSRAILASALSRTQDLGAYFMVLYAAVRQHGSPEALVSDGGSIFKAKQATAIYEALGIRKEQIARRQPW